MSSMPSRWFAAAARLSLAARFRLAAALVAVFGFGWAAWVWATAVDLPERAVSLQRMKVQERQLEIIGGKFAVEAARFSAWFDGLWIGRDLALTLAVITAAITLACLWIARIAEREPFDDETPGEP